MGSPFPPASAKLEKMAQAPSSDPEEDMAQRLPDVPIMESTTNSNNIEVEVICRFFLPIFSISLLFVDIVRLKFSRSGILAIEQYYLIH